MKGRRLMNLKAIVRVAARSWLIMVIMAMLELMFFPALASGNSVLNIVLNIAVTLASVLFAYAGGASSGENDISYGELLAKREEGGYTATAQDRAKCYSRSRALAGMFVGALPWTIMALVVLITGVGYVHVAAEEVPDYLFPVAEDLAMTSHEIVDLIARIMFSGFLGFFTFVDNAGPGLLDYLFLPMSFVYPLAVFIGYLTGPIQHRKKLKMIEEGKRKKLRKIRADQRRKMRQQQPKQPKPEV